MNGFMLRDAVDDDGDAFVSVVEKCWAEYPGCVSDIDGEAPELRALASAMAAKGGGAWSMVFVDNAARTKEVVGLVACWPRDDGVWEVGKMYLDASYRGRNLARGLLTKAEAFACFEGAEELQLWSDTRFTRAHAFYEKRHYLRTGPIRALGDKSNSIEFGYSKPLRGVVTRVLDVAAAGSAERMLGEVLVDCVADGASVWFLPPVAPDAARSFWRRVATEVATGLRILVVAWLDGAISGVVTVDCNTPQNQPHRADVQKLLVHPKARRRGIGSALMQVAEREARKAGRTLLTLDTRAGDAAETLYRGLGYTEAGRIPGYALNPDRTFCDTVLFYKSLAAPS